LIVVLALRAGANTHFSLQNGIITWYHQLVYGIPLLVSMPTTHHDDRSQPLFQLTLKDGRRSVELRCPPPTKFRARQDNQLWHAGIVDTCSIHRA
jgi:hypothetical protein